jgi:mono/diheme cytochrome c family protein
MPPVFCAAISHCAIIFRFRSDHGALVVFILAIGILGSNQALAQEARREGTAKESAAVLYERRCQRCHAKDGGGERDAGVKALPDFRKSDWQARRSDAALRASILDGKGDGMPAFAGQLNEDQVRALIAYVRGLDPKRASPTAAAADFEKQFKELQKEYQALQKELERLSARPTDSEKTAPKSEHKDKPMGKSAVLYHRLCQRCHGTDGKGESEGMGKNSPPDYTDREWHRERSDVHLTKIIWKGKGTVMPAFCDKLTDQETDELIEYIRGFGRRSSSPEATGETEH